MAAGGSGISALETPPQVSGGDVASGGFPASQPPSLSGGDGLPPSDEDIAAYADIAALRSLLEEHALASRQNSEAVLEAETRTAVASEHVALAVSGTLAVALALAAGLFIAFVYKLVLGLFSP